MVDATFATSFNDQWSKREMARLCQLKLDSSLPINPPEPCIGKHLMWRAGF